MIILRDISLRRGAKPLLSDANANLQNGEHIALIGANGCGKSSLFALLLGKLGADSGEIEGLTGQRLAHMAQEVATSDLPAGEYVLQGDQALAGLIAELRQAENSDAYEQVASIHTQLEALDGYDAERRVQLLLRGLGFDADAHSRPVSDFSGGWRIRLNLAQALMTPSDVLLLDEPTNHLDLDATLWLQQWLKAYPGTLLMISHDRDFIDSTCSRILHIEQQSLQSYRGNYSAFETQRAERLANQQASWEKQQQRIAQIEDFVRRFRAKATKAKQAQSRLKELERMQDIAPAHVDSPFSFRFPAPERASDPMLQLRAATLGYGQQAILKGVELRLRPGSRLALLGRNGAGKSTLLKTLVGELKLIEGEYIEGEHCSVGYYDQQQLEALDMDASPVLHLQRLRPAAREQEILDFLGGFNFRGDFAKAPVAPLSGGEKARLALAMVAWQRPNLLILDEPTNHLDLEMCHALEMALQAYEGAVVLVSHDRHLLRNTADELLLVHDGVVEEFNDDLGAYESWLLASLAESQASAKTTNDSPSQSKREQRQQAAARRDQIRPLQKRLKQAEKDMGREEQALAALQEQLADSNLYSEEQRDKLAELLRDEGACKQRLADLEEQWLALQEELEELESGLD